MTIINPSTVQNNNSTVFTNTIDPNFQESETSIRDILTFGAPATVASFASTVGESLGIFEDQDVINALGAASNDLADFYAENREGVRLAGDIGGLFLPGLGAVSLIRGGSFFAKMLKAGSKSGGFRDRLLSSVFTSGKTGSQLMRQIKARDLRAARAGINPMQDILRNKNLQGVYRTKAADSLKETLAFEAGVYATMNESQVLYPDEMSTVDLILLNAALPTVALGAEQMFLRTINRNNLQAAQKVRNKVTNPNEFTADTLFHSREKERSGALTAQAMQADAAREMIDNPPSSISPEFLSASRDQFTTIKTEAQVQMRKEVERMYKDAPFRKELNLKKDEVFTEATSATPAEMNTIMGFLEQNPLGAYGVVSFEHLPETTAAVASKGNKLKSAVNDLQIESTVLASKSDPDDLAKAAQIARRADDLNQHQFFVLDSYGNVTPGGEYRLRWEDTAERINSGERFKFTHSKSPAGDVRMVSVDVQDRVGGKLKSINLGIDEDFIIYGAVGDLTLNQTNALYKLTDNIIDTISNRAQLDTTIAITPKSSHYQIDAAVELIRRDPTKSGFITTSQALKGDGGMDLVDTLTLQSLKEKYKTFKKLSDQMNTSNSKMKFTGPANEKLTLPRIADMLNLPQMKDGSPHPLLELMEMLHSAQKIPEFNFNTLDDVKRAVEQVADMPALGQQFLFENMDLMGRQITNTASKKSTMLLQRGDIKPSTITSDNLIKQSAGYRQQTFKSLSSAREKNAEFVSFITDITRQQAEVIDAAKGVGGLSEGILRGNNILTTSAFRHGNNPTLRAADSFVSAVDKEARKYVGELFKRYEPVFTEIRKPGNRADLHSFNYGYHAAQSFEFGQAVKLGENRWAYTMPSNAYNKTRIKSANYEDVAEMKYIPSATTIRPDGTREYKPLILTDKAHQALTAMSDLSQNLGRNISVLKETAGRGPLRVRAYHVPPSNFLGKDIMYAIENDKVIAAFADNTDAGVRQQANAFREVAESEGRSIILQGQGDIARYHKLQDQAFERIYNMQDSLAQRGKRTGKSVNPDLIRMDDELLSDALSSINRGFESVNRRTRAAIFENELNFVKSAAETDLGLSSATAKAGKSIYQEYERVIYGNPSLTPRDNVGRVYQSVETTYDNIWRAIGDKYRLWRPASDNANSADSKLWRDPEYTKAAQTYSPVANMEEFVHRTYQVTPPQSMKQHMGALNAFTANLALRLFEVGHAVLNLTSLAVTMPPVIKALNKLPSETTEAWRARINSFGIPFNEKDAMFSPARALTSGTHFMFTKQGREVWEGAAKRGYFDQDVMEMMSTLIAPKRGYGAQLVDKIVKKASWVSDSSEQLARGIAFMTGANIALKSAKFNNPENVYLFAHRFADDVIGDFRPNNRPRIFQGALGMPLGLFQTFAVNYYQRLFNYVDTGNKAALFNQFATQSFIFGAQSVPGFALFNDVFASNYDGTVNPVDKITNTFSQDVAELMLYGTLGNLPKMFGAEDGVSIHTRGDMNLRNVPGIWSIDQTPVATLGRDMFAIISKTIAQLRDQGLDSHGMAEVLSNYGLSRPFKNAMEIYTGYSTDRRGQVINSDTQDAFNIATRVAGLKPLSEARAAETFYRIQSTNYAQRGRMAEFREQIRSAMRRGNIKPEEIESAIRQYIRYGGNPQNFSSWLTDQASIALVDRGHAELMKAIKDPTRGYDVRRLMSLYSSGPGDAEFQ